MENVEVTRDVLVREVEEQRRVDGFAEQAGFKVQMRTKRAARVATQSDWFAGLDLLIYLNQLLGEVTVDGFKTVVVADNYVLAIAAGIVADDAHFAVEGCIDGIANIDFNVKTLVHAAESRPIAEIARHVSARRGHGKASQVNLKTIGDKGRRVAVCVGVVPRGVESEAVLHLICLYEPLQCNRIDRLEFAVNGRLAGNEILTIARNRAGGETNHSRSHGPESFQYHWFLVKYRFDEITAQSY